MDIHEFVIDGQKYELGVGDTLYYNNYGTSQGHNIPDYLVVIGFRGNFIIAEYENHYIQRKERVLSTNILKVSNLNPNCEKPDWIINRKFGDR